MIRLELIKLIESNNYELLVNYCETLELDGVITLGNQNSMGIKQDLDDQDQLFVVQCYLLGFVLLDDLNNARFLWKRLGTELQNQVRPIWNICMFMWKREYAQVYDSLLHPMEEWSSELLPLIKATIETYRSKMITLITNAYENLSIERASILLCLNHEEVIQLVQSKSWKIENGYIFPVRLDRHVQTQAESFKLLQDLTQRTLFLELS